MITLGRRGDLHARRQATAFLRSRDVVHRLFADVAPLFKDRPGGYTRIVRIGPRPGDSAELAYLELVTDELVPRARAERAPAAVEEPEPESEDEPEDEPELEPVAEEDGDVEAEVAPDAEDESEDGS